ncbi:MAG: porin family protein [Bacteroidota bacterium]
MRNSLIIALFMSSFTAFGQSVGFSGGINLGVFNEDYADPDLESDYKFRVGYQLGMIVDFNISEQFALRPGLRLSSKGGSLDDPNLEDGDYLRQSLTYLEIPINFTGKFDDFRIYAGPYVAFGLSGSANLNVNGVEQSLPYEFVNEATFAQVTGNNEEIYIKNIDAGVQIGMAYRISQVEIFGEFSTGFVNLTPDIADTDFDPDDLKATNQVISLGLTYFLKSKNE